MKKWKEKWLVREGRWVPCAGTWGIFSGCAAPRKHGFPGLPPAAGASSGGSRAHLGNRVQQSAG